MRPIELVLENFGAYRGRARVDFSLLGPLFLVWGKTGSGKTTLFDAMAYALYGKAPGSREGLTVELRSEYAAAGEAPRVEFTFALGTVAWRAIRSPPYTRPGRGGRLVETGQEARLESRSGEAWSVKAEGVRAVDDLVRELLGLSAEEFSKIILLPQGEFQRFLEMASTDRVAILEKLFPVDLHGRVTALAVERSKAALAEGRRLDADIARLRGEGGGPEGEAELLRLAEEGARLEAERELAMKARLGAAEALERGREDGRRRENQARAQERLDRARLESEQGPALRARLEAGRRAQAARPAMDEALRLDGEAGRGRAALEQRREARQALEAGRPAFESAGKAIPLLAERVAGLDRERGGLAGAIEAWGRLAAVVEAEAAAQVAVREAEAALSAARAKEDEARLAVETSRVGAAAEEAIHEAFTLANQAFEEAKETEKAVAAYEAARVAVAASEAALSRAAADREPVDQALAEAEALHSQNLAAGLAATLVQGEACPVCGSRDHPAPALPATSGAEGPGLGELRKRREKAIASEASAAKAQERDAEALSQAAAALAARLAEGAPLPALAEAQRSRLEAEARAGEAGRARRESSEAKKRFELLATTLEGLVARRSGAEAALAAAQVGLAGRAAELRSARAQAGETDPRPRALALDKERRGLEAERLALVEGSAAWERDLGRAQSLLESALEAQPLLEAAAAAAGLKAREALAEAGFSGEAELRAALLGTADLAELERELRRLDTEVAAAEAAATEAARALGSGPAPDLDRLEAAAREAAAIFEGIQAGLDAHLGARHRLEALVEGRRAVEEERRELDRSSGGLAALADLLAGNLPPRRLPFKNFVLGAYFRAVVGRASLRLAELTDERYTLVADEGQGRGKLGLDILVRDAWTGRTRQTATLSGGERFLSSLALALGLADTIMSRSGGVSLDAVFIDEGFGSLDEETLDRAILALDRARGSRMIGIVSHVAELRGRIPSRIEVRKGRGGSSLEIIA